MGRYRKTDPRLRLGSEKDARMRRSVEQANVVPRLAKPARQNIRWVVALLVVVLPGCLSGHLLDAARRRERPVAIAAAGLEGDRLLVRYMAEVTGDDGAALGRTEAAAALPLAALRAPVSPAADTVARAWVAPARVARSQPVPIARAGAPDGSAGCTGPTLVVVSEDGRDTALVWRDGPAAASWAPVPTAALTRLRTAPWAWPLLPAAVAADAVAVPVLMFFAPALMVVGE